MNDITEHNAQEGKPKRTRIPLSILFMTSVTLILLLFLTAVDVKTTSDVQKVSKDPVEIVRLYDYKSKMVAYFCIILIAFMSSAALITYNRYENNLERTVEERTAKLTEVMRLNQDIIRNSPVGILTIDQDGEIEYANPAMRDIAGVKSENDLLGLNVLKLESTNEAGLVGYFTMGLGGRSFEVDDITYTSHTSGKKSIRHYRGVPLYDDKKEVKSLLLLIEDVTEKKKAEEETRWIINGASTPMFVIDTDHRIRFWNKAMEELTGLKQENMLATRDQWKAFYDDYMPTLSDLLIDGKFDDIAKLYDKSAKSKLISGAYEAETWLNEGIRYLTLTAAPIYDPQGMIVAVVESVKDITDVALSEERYRNIVENANDLIMILNVRGSIVFANNKIEDLLGFRIADLIGEDFRNLVQPDDRDRVMEALLHSYQMNIPLRNFEVRFMKKDGTVSFGEMSSGYMKHGENITGIQLIIRDVTEHKMADELRKKQINDLKDLGQKKDDFMSIAAHEMETPLMSIINAPNSMLDDANLTAEQKHNLKAILSDGHKLRIIIDRILTESRLKADKIN